MHDVIEEYEKVKNSMELDKALRFYSLQNSKNNKQNIISKQTH